MTSARSLARPLLSAIFVSGGIETLRNPAPRVETAAPVVPGIANRLGLPEDPDLLVRLNAGAQVAAGTLLAIGKLPRLAALVLIGSAVPTTYAGHRFWELDDKQTRAQQRIHFLKNLGLIGGLMLAALDTGGAPSVAWRLQRRAKQVRRATSGAGAAVASSSNAVADGARQGRAAVGQAVQTAAGHRLVS